MWCIWDSNYCVMYAYNNYYDLVIRVWLTIMYLYICNVTLHMLSTCITRSFNECTCLCSSVNELLLAN